MSIAPTPIDRARPARDGAAETLEIAVSGGMLAADSVGDGRTVLLLHGWTLDRRAWQPQYGLSSRFRLIALDRRGNGASTAPADLAAEPDDLARILDVLALDRVAIVGMSQGARVALAFADRHPDRVVALALQGAPLPFIVPAQDDPGEQVPIDRMRRLAAEGRLDDLRQLWAEHPLMAIGPSADHAALYRIAAAYDARDLLGPSRALETGPAHLRRLPHPTLLVTGTRETAARRAAAQMLATLLPRATHREIEGGYHLCNLSHPDLFNALILTFLEKNHVG